MVWLVIAMPLQMFTALILVIIEVGNASAIAASGTLDPDVMLSAPPGATIATGRVLTIAWSAPSTRTGTASTAVSAGKATKADSVCPKVMPSATVAKYVAFDRITKIVASAAIR